MALYNIAANQRLASPVSAFQQGRALKLAEARAEQDMRLASQQEELNEIAIESAGKPDPAEQRAADEARRKRAAELLTFTRDAATRSLSTYQQMIDGGLPEEEAMAAAQRQQSEDIQFAKDIWGDELGSRIDPDGQFSPQEARAALAKVEDVMGKANLTTAQFREGEDFVTRVVRDGMPVMGDEGVLARSPIREGTPSTTVNVGQAESAANKKYGESVGERASGRVSLAQEATNQNLQLDRVSVALDAGATTGFGQEALLNLKQAGNTLFGMELTDADTEQEVIRKISNEMALRLRNPESGMGLTGNTSNRDLQFLKDSVIGLSRSEGGNRKIIDYMKRVNQMKVDIAQEQARIIARNGGKIPADLDTQIMNYVDNYNFLRDGEREQIENMVSSGNDPKGPEALPGFKDLAPELQDELRERWQRQQNRR